MAILPAVAEPVSPERTGQDGKEATSSSRRSPTRTSKEAVVALEEEYAKKTHQLMDEMNRLSDELREKENCNDALTAMVRELEKEKAERAFAAPAEKASASSETSTREETAGGSVPRGLAIHAKRRRRWRVISKIQQKKLGQLAEGER